MDILGIGPLELLFIFIIILVVLGPNEMVKTGALLGRYLRKLMMSPTWKLIQDTSREIRYLPNKLARQAGLDEIQKEVREGLDLPKIGGFPEQIEQDKRFEAWTNPTEKDPGPCRSGTGGTRQTRHPKSNKPSHLLHPLQIRRRSSQAVNP